MKRLLIACILSLIPAWALAAYQNPTVLENNRQADDEGVILFEFTGNAGEPTVQRRFVVQPNATVTSLRNWVDDTIAELNLLQTARTLPSLQPGQTVTRLARTTPPPTAKQVWLDKLRRYLDLKNSDITAAASAISALKADLEATYQAGYLD